MKASSFLLSIFLILTLISCDSEEENPLNVDVSDIEMDLEVVRLEQSLFETDTSNLRARHKELTQQLGTFYDFYLLEVLKAGSAYDPMVADNLKLFVSDSAMRAVYESTQDKFSKMDVQLAEIETAFKHVKYYYKDALIPKVVTFTAPFMYRCVPMDSVMGIGLEMYLGPDDPMVKEISVQYLPQYVKDGMREEYMSVDVIRAFLEHHYAPVKGDDFLSAILYEGKVHYAIDAMMPEKPNHYKIRYSEEDWQWCLKNETNIWHEIVDQKWLYSKDNMLINKMVGEAPFTATLPKDSPPRVGAWIGWKIVRDFMNANPDLTVVDLLKMPLDKNQKILNAYNPE